MGRICNSFSRTEDGGIIALPDSEKKSISNGIILRPAHHGSELFGNVLDATCDQHIDWQSGQSLQLLGLGRRLERLVDTVEGANCLRGTGMTPRSEDTAWLEFIGNLRQQIGETLATVKSIEQRQLERTQDARVAEAAIHAEIRTVKHDARNVEQILQGKLDLLQRRIEEDRKAAAESMRSLKDELLLVHGEVSSVQDELKKTQLKVENVTKPVNEIIEIRRRLGTLTALMASIGGVIAAVMISIWHVIGDSVMRFLFNGRS